MVASHLRMSMIEVGGFEMRACADSIPGDWTPGYPHRIPCLSMQHWYAVMQHIAFYFTRCPMP